MGIPTRDQLLAASDIRTEEVELPSVGFTVKIRSLPAAYSNRAQTEGTRLVTIVNDKGRVEQAFDIDHERVDALKVLHALISPKLTSIEDAFTLSQNLTSGAWKHLVSAIDRLSGIDERAEERVEATFPAGGPGEDGPSARPEGSQPDAAAERNGGPVVPVRAGA